MANGQSFLDKFAEVSAKVGNQVHLRSLRDGFSTIMPIFILAGIAALLNNVVFTFLWSADPSSPGLFPNADVLATAQYWGNSLTQGALSISAILLCAMVGYSLANNKRFDNPVSCVVVALAVFFIMMPQTVAANLATSSPLYVAEEVTTAQVSSAFITNYTGTNGMFTAIIIGLFAPTLFIKASGVEKLRIKMPEGVPPAVEKSFNVLIPMLLTLGAFGVLSMVLYAGFQTDVTALINTFIQTPLRALTTNPIGLVVIYSLGMFLFTLGIHQSTINGVLVEPVLTVVLVEATSVYSSGGIDAVIANPDLWLNMNTINVYALMGGSGCTLALLIATFIWGKWRPSREVAKLGILPAIFNINEPVIYGLPDRVQHPAHGSVRAQHHHRHPRRLLRHGHRPRQPHLHPGALDHPDHRLGHPVHGRRHPRGHSPDRAARDLHADLPALHEGIGDRAAQAVRDSSGVVA